LSDQLAFEVKGSKVYGRYFRQDYDLHGGVAAGQYSNGNTAAVENTYGQGKTLLIGSFPGAGYYLHHGAATKELFAGLLKWAGAMQQVAIDDTAVQARLHRDAGGGAAVLWVTNPTRTAKTVKITLAGGGFQSAEDVWGGVTISGGGRELTMSVPARDAVVARLG
jgi:beta-galactosidase